MRLLTLLCALALQLPRPVFGFYAQPEAVHFLESPDHVTTCEGCGSVVLRCGVARQSTIADLPQPEIQWTVNGTSSVRQIIPGALVQLLTNADSAVTISQLTIPASHTAHSGSYRCEARDGSDLNHCKSLPCVPTLSVSSSASVRILDGRVLTEEVYSGGCGSTVYLQCGLPSSNGGAFTSWWLKDGVELLPTHQTDRLLPNKDLLVHRHDNSTHSYTCIAEFTTPDSSCINVTLSRYSLHTLTTLTPNTSIQLVNHKPVLHSGKNTTLICTYDRSERSCDLTTEPKWYHNGRKINSTGLLSSGHTLRLEGVGVVNSGVYCCVVEGAESCTSLRVMETTNVRPLTRFIDPLRATTLKLPSPLDTPLDTPLSQLQWLHNGVHLELYSGQASLNRTSNSSELYGIYQSFIEEVDGTWTQLSLTRVMPHGWSNPPGSPAIVEVPRAGIDFGEIAIRFSWTPPLYTGGLDELWFKTNSNGMELNPVMGNSTVDVSQLRFFYDFKVGVVSEEGAILSEWSAMITTQIFLTQCNDALPPPSLLLSCDRGRVNLMMTHSRENAHLYRAGGCSLGNQTVSLPSGTVSLESVAVGTHCGFEGAAAALGEECGLGNCDCYNRYNLEYSLPTFCNVTGLVQFNQSEYSVDEGASSVEVCVTAQGHGFSVTLATEAATAIASEDFSLQWVELVFTADVLTHCVNVSVMDDVWVEGAEQFIITITTDHPLVDIPSPAATVTILDNDYAGVSVETVKEVSENDSSLLVCVSVGDQLRREVALKLDTLNGTALEGIDFLGVHTEIRLSQYNTSSCLTVGIVDDLAVEGVELFSLAVSSEDESVRGVEREIAVMDDDYVGVAFIGNSTLTLPINVTSFTVCIAIEGELNKNVTVSLATNETTGGRALRELVFRHSPTVVCVNLTFNVNVLQQLLLILLTFDPQVRTMGSGLTILIPNHENATSGPESVSTMDYSVLLVVLVLTVVILPMLVLLISLMLCVRWRYRQQRYNWHMKIGLKQSKCFSSDWQDPISIGPTSPCPSSDEITLYEEFYPTKPHMVSTLSLGKSSVNREFSLEPQCGVTSEEILEHLQQYSNISDEHQQDSGIGDYPGIKYGGDSGSFFSRRSISSYVHCGQYNCTCCVCVASREGKSLKAGETPLGVAVMRDSESPLQFVSLPSSMSLPELRSHDNHVITPLPLSQSSEKL